MITKIKIFVKEHTFMTLYMLVLLLLLYGVLVISGDKHLGKMGVIFGSVLVSYFIFIKLKWKGKLEKWLENRPRKIDQQKLDLLLLICSGGVLITVLLHFVYMGGSPPIQALSLETSDEVALLRRSITDGTPGYLNYISSFNIRAFLPFLIFYFYVKEKKIFYYIFLIVGCFYAFSLMQKSYVITLLAPVFIYSLTQRKWLFSLKHAALMLLVIFGLSFNANPEFSIPDEEIELSEEDRLKDSLDAASTKNYSNFERVVMGLYTRIMIVPGEMVSEWFDIIPEKRPFLHGQGYRVIAKLQGQEHRNYSAELYPLIRPANARRGLKGNVNTASFMYDYANFGVWGLLLSGISISILFLIIESLFGNDFRTKLSLNLFFILIISSTALTTTMFSGGWGLTLVMYFVFLKVRPQKTT